MKKITVMSSFCAIALSMHASDIGSIEVASSTINDQEQKLQYEVSSVATVSGAQVEEINPKSVADILATIPGITYEMTGTDAIKIHIRGIENQMYRGERPGVAVIIDGVSVQETAGKINVDLDNIESIKVIKGGASYLYGNDAIAGAIVITTKNPKSKNTSKAEIEHGSFNSKRATLTTNQAFDNSALQLQGSYRDTDGYWDDAFITIKSINGKYQYYIDDTSDITIGYDYTKRETGDGNSVSGTINAQLDPTSTGGYSYSGYYDSTLTKGFVTYSKDFGENSNFLLRLHNYSDDKIYKTAKFTKEKNEIWKQNGGKAEYKTSFDTLALLAGVDIQRNTTDEKTTKLSDGSTDNDYETTEAINALYTELQYQPISRFTLTLNARYDTIKHEYKDMQDSSNDVSPTYNIGSYRFGATYAVSPTNILYTSAATGFRAPTVTQISRNKVGLAAEPTRDIPSIIDVETTYNYELGIRGKISDLNYDASIYQLDRKDYIGVIAGNYITSDDENESFYDNVGDMRSRGFELSLSSNKDEMFAFDLAYTFLEAKFTSYMLSQQLTTNTAGWGQPSNATFQRLDLSDNYIPRTSKHNLNLTLYYKPNKKALIATEIRSRSSYYADEVNANKQKGYTFVNLRADYKADENFDFFARVDNLFDKTYYQFVNISSSALATMEEDATIRVAPPRAFYLGARYKF